MPKRNVSYAASGELLLAADYPLAHGEEPRPWLHTRTEPHNSHNPIQKPYHNAVFSQGRNVLFRM